MRRSQLQPCGDPDLLGEQSYIVAFRTVVERSSGLYTAFAVLP